MPRSQGRFTEEGCTHGHHEVSRQQGWKPEQAGEVELVEWVSRDHQGEADRVDTGEVGRVDSGEVGRVDSAEVDRIAAGEVDRIAAGEVDRIAAGEVDRIAAGEVDGSPRAKSTGSPQAKATGSRNAASEAKPSTLRRAADRSKGPAIAAGTAAAAIAGGLVLKSRLGRKRILGVPVPRSVTNGGLSSVDLQSLAKTVGKASRQVGETSKEISKDIERIGDRAERFGKLLS